MKTITLEQSNAVKDFARSLLDEKLYYPRLPKVLIPMIRRTFPELITNDLVNVQPLPSPIGLKFYLNEKY